MIHQVLDRLPGMMDIMWFMALLAMVALGVYSLRLFLRSPWLKKKGALDRNMVIRAALGVVFSGTVIWSLLVNSIVPDPYMDEIFHIPQAQQYCHGKIFEWDDKLTTPPGLYLVPLAAFLPLYKIFGFLPQILCSPPVLRMQNAICICLLFWVALLCRHKIERFHHNEHQNTKPLDHISQYSVHTALNIALFPVLFFFSGLYYTDVMSTLLVLFAFNNTLNRISRKRSSLRSSIWTVIIGISTLFMRQTNIFWIVVFLGSIEAVHSLKMLLPKRSLHTHNHGPSDVRSVITEWAKKCASGDIWDSHINNAGPINLLRCVLSIAVAAICNPGTVIDQIWPYMVTLGVFASFVIWNGGVVLGDKNNHVATIHLPQMLYIWPMFAFFSLPLAIPTMIELCKWVARSRQHKKSEGPSREIMLLREELARSPNFIHQIAAPWVLVPNWIWLLCRIILACCVAAVVVHFNTIVHPFTLADNRHYMFYIFRYSIRRGELVRLALVPVYVVSAWICWTILSPCHDFIGDRIPIRSARGLSHCSEWSPHNSRNESNIVVSSWFPMSNDAYPDPDARKMVAFNDMNIKSLHQSDHPAIDPTTSSFVISLCIATTLSLMTAPLVEPRYDILPWVFFRLLCPAWRVHEHKYDGGGHKVPKYAPIQYLCDIGARLDVRLVLETFWFLLINLVTMFIFLNYPFYWKEDNGAVVDFGRQQRFIW